RYYSAYLLGHECPSRNRPSPSRSCPPAPQPRYGHYTAKAGFHQLPQPPLPPALAYPDLGTRLALKAEAARTHEDWQQELDRRQRPAAPDELSASAAS
nr:hypothetical protein [Tanacetum cinerariifolium]